MGIISDFIELPIISKFSASGLQEYFCHIEIMSDKKNADYKRLLDHLGCKAENLLMIGNSIKSDIIPI